MLLSAICGWFSYSTYPTPPWSDSYRNTAGNTLWHCPCTLVDSWTFWRCRRNTSRFPSQATSRSCTSESWPLAFTCFHCIVWSLIRTSPPFLASTSRDTLHKTRQTIWNSVSPLSYCITCWIGQSHCFKTGWILALLLKDVDPSISLIDQRTW